MPMPSTDDAFATAWLKPGARLHVIAPSSPFPVDAFERGVERLRTRYVVDFAADITNAHGYLAGDDTRRSRELQRVLQDPNVDGIVAARGGYGATRLLAQLDVAAVRARPKLLVGFSDITALHALWAQARVASVHGSMVATLSTLPDALVTRYFDALEGRGPHQITDLQAFTRGRAQGVLLGGNLAVLASLLGTPHMPQLDGAILFLEDVGERPYRVDRMLTSLRSSGVLHGVRGIVLGAFEKADAGADGVSIEQVLRERTADLGIPVLTGLPAGHIDDNLELPFGTRVTLDADAGTLFFDSRQQGTNA
jgi:muramoyltetrapeptide carboxypeptidase